MDPVLALRGVSKQYGKRTILSDVSLELAHGSFTAITGRSGSGKSTLVSLIAGLAKPSGGEILVDGTNVAQLDDDGASALRLRRIGLVFQGHNLLPDLTAIQNVRLPLELAGASRAEAQTRAAELLEIVNLRERALQRPGRLSGGEAQRVAIARALANKPALLLADEPTGSLDRQNAMNVLDHLRDVNRRLGTTILVITHDPLVVARTHAVYELEDGALVARAVTGRSLASS